MNATLGFVLAIVGGILMGSFSLPMKKISRWAWETTWLVWAVAALVITPWVIAAINVPEMASVYTQAGAGTLTMVFFFGVGWGMGAVLFGRSIHILGMSLAFAISIGLTLALGSLVPMARKPELFATAAGQTLTVGIALMLIGVIISAIAGRRKEAQMQAAAGAQPPASSSATSAGAFVKGLTLCVLSGIFNPMINFAFEFGDNIKAAAAAAGASDGGASDAIWAITLLGGFATNLVYCSILLTRNKAWSGYRLAGTRHYWFLAALMGVTWVLSITVYGRAAGMMGALGSSAGWAITMGCCIAVSNAWGIITGEWRQAGGKPLRTMCVGLAVILVAITVIGYGNSLKG